jgi:hypothetical protein
MMSREDRFRPGTFEEPSALLCDAKVLAQQGLGRRRAQAHDRRWLNDEDLGLQPRSAGFDLAGTRLFMQPAFSAWLPAKVLHDIGNVHVVAFETRFDKGVVQKPARGANEGLARNVFLITRRLTDKHDGRPPWPFAKHGLCGVLVQIAPPAMLGRLAHRFQVHPIRKKFRCRHSVSNLTALVSQTPPQGRQIQT